MVGDDWSRRIVVGITGASGATYGHRLIGALAEARREIHVILSNCGEELLRIELGIGRNDLATMAHRIYSNDDMTAPLASGSYRFDSMVIAPCSMRTIAAIASGDSGCLMSRVAEVCLKERRRLVLVPRETPLNLLHIRNMETLTLAGATVLPAMPAFYPRPVSVDDMVSFIVGKIMDQLQIEHNLFRRWEGAPRRPGS